MVPDRPTHPRVAIHYRRPPDRVDVYDQRVVLERDDVIVTLSEPIEAAGPMEHDGELIFEPGSLGLWFTFPGLWHDIGIFHARGGERTGIYANVLTPVRIEGHVWRTTDLYLDVWMPVGGGVHLLDEAELDEALSLGHADEVEATRAREEATAIMRDAASGAWPPPVVAEWSLERALDRLEALGST